MHNHAVGTRPASDSALLRARQNSISAKLFPRQTLGLPLPLAVKHAPVLGPSAASAHEATGRVATTAALAPGGLNQDQMQAVRAANDAVCVKAGPGTGKTRVITTRVAWLIREHNVPPAEIMAITFTRKAANEIKGRLQTMLRKTEARQVTCGTVHSVCMTIIREHLGRLGLGLTAHFVVLDQNDSRRLVADVLDQVPYLAQLSAGQRTALAYYLAELMDVAAGETDTVHNSTQQLRLCDAVDFGDLLSLAVHGLQQPDIGGIYRRRFSNIQVDEFQDINKPQYALVKLLKGTSGSLFGVGDMDQAIYAWRGATKAIMLHDFPRDFPNASILHLAENYRNAHDIQLAANVVLLSGGSVPMHQRLNSRPVQTRDRRGVPYVVMVHDNDDEMAFLAQRIANLQDEGHALRDMAILVRMNYQAKELAQGLRAAGIPCRTAAVDAFDKAMKRDTKAFLLWALNPKGVVWMDTVCHALAESKRIENHRIGAEMLYKLKAASHAQRTNWAALTCDDLQDVWMSEQDVETVTQALNSLAPGQTINHLLPTHLVPDLAKVLPPSMGALDPDNARALGTLRALLVLLRSTGCYKGFAGVMQLVLAIGQYEKREKAAARHVQFVQRLLQPRAGSAGAAAGGGGGHQQATGLERLRGQVSRLTMRWEEEEEEQEARRWHAGHDAVNVMTLHGSKGLEFKTVFIARVEEGNMPLVSKRAAAAGGVQCDEEEERRLMYVGMTRAEDRVYLISRQKATNGASIKPSIFVDELVDEATRPGSALNLVMLPSPRYSAYLQATQDATGS